ncbi:SHOCT domain-containing protein [Lacrimispora sp. AGF001]
MTKEQAQNEVKYKISLKMLNAWNKGWSQ